MRAQFVRAGKDAPGTLTLGNSRLMVEAAINGLGTAYAPEPYTADALRTGTMVTVLED